MRTLVIGDVHGHADRLAELIEKAGALADDVEIVLLGDIGQYDRETHMSDLLTWQLVEKLPRRTVLWGNHDYANVKPEQHSFRGWDPAYPEVMEIIQRVKPQFAAERHGYLLTHAGLAPRFHGENASAVKMAEIINMCEGMPVIDDISYRRGGFATQGGILWRDESEKLADLPQVFAHSCGPIRRSGRSWCIDVASKHNDSLAGLWLVPSEPEQPPVTPWIVAVGPDAEIHETPFPEDA